MNYFNNNANNEILARDGVLDISNVLRQVYLWMTLGLLATAGTALLVAQTSLPLMLAQPVSVAGSITGRTGPGDVHQCTDYAP